MWVGKSAGEGGVKAAWCLAVMMLDCVALNIKHKKRCAGGGGRESGWGGAGS